jgi:hypothetical protein
MNYILDIMYKIYYCKIHNNSIYYIASNKFMQQTLCWDCEYDANKKKL